VHAEGIWARFIACEEVAACAGCNDERGCERYANVVFVTGYKLHPDGGFGPGRIRATVLTSRIESREFCVDCSLQCGALDVAAAGTNALTAVSLTFRSL
jgi:hypothetical protein